ncbi:LuxR family transcriptional regulator [Entomohabitans teleogrylli]|uniref:LuxR family transcriptional regulator n=1 Tax=Entomohabitans teleogrylli TaxID=1384589 RepID=UPI0009E7A063|nr:LuxR family transcriptional regulator [Entomohabitans teleogrylli]
MTHVVLRKEPACRESTIAIITSDNYFYNAVEHLLDTLMPEIISHNSTFYSVIRYKDIFEMDLQDAVRRQDMLLIADYDVRMIGNSHILELLQRMAVFRSIMLVTNKGNVPGNANCFLSKDIAVNKVKDKLLDFIIKSSHPDNLSEKLPFSEFTEREREIIRLILKGRRIDSIAQKLQLSPKTIYAHRSRIYRKLGVHSLQGFLMSGSVQKIARI